MRIVGLKSLAFLTAFFAMIDMMTSYRSWQRKRLRRQQQMPKRQRNHRGYEICGITILPQNQPRFPRCALLKSLQCVPMLNEMLKKKLKKTATISRGKRNLRRLTQWNLLLRRNGKVSDKDIKETCGQDDPVHWAHNMDPCGPSLGP